MASNKKPRKKYSKTNALRRALAYKTSANGNRLDSMFSCFFAEEGDFINDATKVFLRLKKIEDGIAEHLDFRMVAKAILLGQISLTRLDYPGKEEDVQELRHGVYVILQAFKFRDLGKQVPGTMIDLIRDAVSLAYDLYQDMRETDPHFFVKLWGSTFSEVFPKDTSIWEFTLGERLYASAQEHNLLY